MHSARHAELFEEFCKDRLPDDDVYVPPQHQPVNPEDEDDVVPDQHAAFGITRALGTGGGKKGTAWKDLGLGDLMGRGPGGGANGAVNVDAGNAGARGTGASRVQGGNTGSAYRGMPR